ncbi:MAG: asparagine synthase (glutamine-hydrolyzing) [Terriglobia bacterium]
MCGIVGYTHLRRPADPAFLRQITHLLHHRGPDQEGTFVSPQIALGAVRLKIIDLEGGQQPMQSEDGSTVLAYNGEIYNYAALRQELIARGRRFQSSSDTEVLLQAFLEWDVDCLQRIKACLPSPCGRNCRGGFILARDRMGIKPLYFASYQRDLYFGSELKVLFAHPEISRRLDLTALDQYLSLNYVPCPRTLVEGIEKLPPGHFLEWRGGEFKSQAYWNLEFHPVETLGETEAMEQLDGLLRQSVKEHLISDVPLGILLSGGVDSSTIVHYAAEAFPGRLKTFSISFHGRRFDESDYARTVAEHYDTEHHELNLSRDLELQETIRQFANYADEPCGDSSSLPVWYVSQLCRRHVTVALSGEGADELFGGYLTYQADRFSRLARRVPTFLRQAVFKGVNQCWPVSDEKISLEYMVKRFLEGSFLQPAEAHWYWNGAFSDGQKDRLCTFERRNPWKATSLIEVNGRLGPLNRFLFFDQKYYLADDILAKVDRMSMAHSLEVRPPFLDHEIVEFAANLPERFKIRGLRQKVLLKQLMQGKLPPEILTRGKMGFDIPAHDWLRRELKPLFLEASRPSVLAQTGVFRAEVLRQWLESHAAGEINLGFHLWGMLILLLWMDKWQIQPPTRTMEPASRFATLQEVSPIA